MSAVPREALVERLLEHVAEFEQFLGSLSAADEELVRRNMRTAPPGAYYYPIYRSFLDHAQTRLLSDVAFRVLIVLRGTFGPAGIEQHYGLRNLLLQHLLYSGDEIENALAELEAMKFIRRNGFIIWIRDHLRGNPGYSAASPTQRLGVQRHIAGLPEDEPLVVAWRKDYPEWLEPVKLTPEHGKRRTTAPHTPSHTPVGRVSHGVADTTKNLELKTKNPLAKRLPAPEEQQGGGELDVWLSTAVTILAGAYRPRTVTPDVETHARELLAKGVTAEQLADAARAMLAEKGLDSAGLPMLVKEYPRWQRNAHAVDAGERWDLYSREGLTRNREHVDFDALLAGFAERGVWPSAEAARAELTAVKPWDIGRKGLPREGSVRLVAERLNAMAA